MKPAYLLVAVFSAVLLGACASQQKCAADADYRNAAAIPPIQPAEGLSLPQSASALKVPEISPAATQAAATEPMPRKGKGTACLDYPPEIVPIPAANGPAKS